MSGPFPHREPFTIGEYELTAAQVVELLADQITARRRVRIDAVIAARIYGTIGVLDGLYDRGNVSAVLRTAEGLGFGEVHIIETLEEFKRARRVTQGAEKWLDVRKWDGAAACVENLQSRGFQIIATSLEAATPLADVDFTRPTALVFGNERDGVSPDVLAASDARVILPMSGFAQSFNISVAAALMFYHAFQNGAAPDLDEAQQTILRAEFYIRSVEHHAEIVRRKLQQGDVTV